MDISDRLKDDDYYKKRLFECYYSTHYSSIAQTSDEQWNWVINLTHKSFGNYFSNLDKNSKILDAGCGIGYLEYYLIRAGFTNIHAVDVSQEQIEMAKHSLRSHNTNYQGKIKFNNCGIFEYLERNNGFDIISLIDVVEHFSKNEALCVMELAFEKLNDDGLILIRVPNMEYPFRSVSNFYQDFTHEAPFTRSSLNQCLLAAGFNETKTYFEEWPHLKSKNLLDKLKIVAEDFYFYFLTSMIRAPHDSFCPNILGIGRKISMNPEL